MATNRYIFRELVSNLAPSQGGDSIGKCTELLSNRMQCTQAAKFLATDLSNNTSRQVCTRHSLILESQGREWKNPEEPAQAGNPVAVSTTSDKTIPATPAKPATPSPAQTIAPAIKK